MKAEGGLSAMQVQIIVSDKIIRAAQDRNTGVLEFVEMLIDKGYDDVMQHPVLNNAMDRIRALRASDKK